MSPENCKVPFADVMPGEKSQPPTRFTLADIERVARIIHAANKAYCESLGDMSQQEWNYAADWQKQSVQNGVLHWLLSKTVAPSDSHESWLAEKLADGWKYGPVKDPAKKEHPCCVPYSDLPEEQRLKDVLFLAICGALLRKS